RGESTAGGIVKCVRVPAQVAVEGGIGRDQGDLERLDGAGDVVVAQGPGLTREGPVEAFDVAGDGRQGRNHIFGTRIHLDRGLDRSLGLRLQVFGAAIPELGDVADGGVDGGRIARPLLESVADRCRDAIDTAHADVVAGVAADDTAGGETAVEPQLPTQRDLLLGDRVALGILCARGDRFEDRPRLRHQLVCGFTGQLATGSGNRTTRRRQYLPFRRSGRGCRGGAGRVHTRRLYPGGFARSAPSGRRRSEEHTSELQSRENLVCRLLLEKKKS